MKRREALRNIGLTTGFVVASPGLISLLQSCTTEAEKFVPAFMDQSQADVIAKFADVFLPKTEDLPSAGELNVPQFIDTYWNEVPLEEEQALIKEALGKFTADLKAQYNEDLSKLTEDNVKDYLDKNLLVKGEEDEERKANPEAEMMTKAEMLGGLKWMCINAYKTTEQIGENVLAYDPIPTAYYCGDLNELSGGKSWSL